MRVIRGRTCPEMIAILLRRWRGGRTRGLCSQGGLAGPWPGTRCPEDILTTSRRLNQDPAAVWVFVPEQIVCLQCRIYCLLMLHWARQTRAAWQLGRAVLACSFAVSSSAWEPRSSPRPEVRPMSGLCFVPLSILEKGKQFRRQRAGEMSDDNIARREKSWT